MRVIEVDDEVYSHIESLAIPYEDRTPNDTLRRHFFGPKPSVRKQGLPADLNDLFKGARRNPGASRTKKPKANLAELIRQGLLTDGEELTLIDYSGNRIPNGTASVSGSQLRHKGRTYSMSELACLLLSEQGYQSQSVRGPAHWVTSKGKTIKDLWDECLERLQKGAA